MILKGQPEKDMDNFLVCKKMALGSQIISLMSAWRMTYSCPKGNYKKTYSVIKLLVYGKPLSANSTST